MCSTSMPTARFSSRLSSPHASGGRAGALAMLRDPTSGMLDGHTYIMKPDDGNQGGIYLAGVGVGVPGTYNDTLMDVLSRFTLRSVKSFSSRCSSLTMAL